ncbi:MAG TPA: TonB-dependent receptor plug domain-containing protein, partial [Gemmatimonadales bacterium]|nr:TonB-dependent receptor plug domain-containing protein [Gemmatimonadales bacterium]
GFGEQQDDPVNRLADLSPDDVESIEVLRGAAASSIYGSKAANGVLIIRTKRGRAGKARATITQRVGFSELLRGPATRQFSVSDPFPYSAAKVAPYVVGGQLPFYDHLKELTDSKPFAYETDMNVSGGSENTAYFLGGSSKRDGGIIGNTFDERQNLRANVDQTFSDRLKLNVSTAFNRTATDKGFTNNDNNGASVTYAIAYVPGFVNVEPVNGVYPQPGISYLGSNPLQTAVLAKNTETVYRFTGGATLTWQALETARNNLRIVGSGGVDLFQQKAVVISPPELFFEQTQTNPGTSALSNADSRQWNWNLNAIHSYTPASGSFKATTSGGVQVEDRELGRSRVVAKGLLPGQSNIDQASVIQSPFEFNSQERTLAFYGQEEVLTLRERLNLTAGFRAERSSANGDTKKYFLYPKVLASYRFPELLGEGTEVKLRGAYGETGNQALFGQKFTTLASAVIGGTVGTVIQGTAGAPDIKPERIKELEAGIDAQLWHGRATLEVTGYTRHTYDLLLQSTPAPSTGYGIRIFNGGVLWNEGIEIAAGVTPIQTKDVNWLFSTTFTSLKNRVQDLGSICQTDAAVCGFRPPVAGFGLAYGEFFIQKGQPITQIIGTDTIPGSSGALTTRYLGQANPRFVWSASSDVRYRRLSFSMLWEWRYGGVEQNQTLSLYDCNGLAPDTGTPVGRARFDACNVWGIAPPFVQSTSALKLREASIAVDLPERWAGWFGARTARASVTGRNLLLKTNYFGYDPEESNFGQQAISRNIDLGPYPPMRSFYFSITAGF